jgi:kynurenine formamidase
VNIIQTADLSHPLHTDMPVYPGDPTVSLSEATTIERDGFNVLHLHMGSQSGTHMDAPLHFLEGGTTIDAISPDTFMGQATIARVTGLGDGAVIGASDIPTPAGAGEILLLNTGWSEHWGTERYFAHPYLSAAAAERIVTLGYKMVAVDALSVDQTEGSTGDFTAHMVLLGAEIPICENLTNLEAICWGDPWVSLLPIRILGGDGAPIRAVSFQLGHD